MKKLGKLSINLNKVIKNEELVNLRGGYSDPCYTCTVVACPGCTPSTGIVCGNINYIISEFYRLYPSGASMTCN